PKSARQLGGPDATVGGHSDAGLWGDYLPAIRRWERVTGRAAPAPREPAPRGGERLSPAFVEWLMGLDEGHVTGVPGLTRSAQLKALGNGVVPRLGAAALSHLVARIGLEFTGAARRTLGPARRPPPCGTGAGPGGRTPSPARAPVRTAWATWPRRPG